MTMHHQKKTKKKNKTLKKNFSFKKKKNQLNVGILKSKMLESMTILFFKMPSELLQQVVQ